MHSKTPSGRGIAILASMQGKSNMPWPAKAEIPKVDSGTLRDSNGTYSSDGEWFLSLNGGLGPMATDGQGMLLQQLQELLQSAPQRTM